MAALFELAHKKSVSDLVVEAGGLKILLQAMKKGNASVKALSAGTLGKLAIDIDLLVQLASQGKIPPLVRSVFHTLDTCNASLTALGIVEAFLKMWLDGELKFIFASVVLGCNEWSPIDPKTALIAELLDVFLFLLQNM